MCWRSATGVAAHRLFLHLGRLRIHRFFPRHEVDLAVDHHAAIARQADHDVRAQAAAIVVGARGLAFEVRAFFQAGAAQHAFEHQLAPVAAHLRVALECARERRGLRGHVLVERLEFLHGAEQRGAFLRFVAVHRVDALAEGAELVGEGLEQQLDVGLRLAGGRAHVLFELLAALLEGLARELGELRRELLLRVAHEGLGLGAGALGLVGFGAGALDGGGVFAGAFAQAGDFRAQLVALARAGLQFPFEGGGAHLRFDAGGVLAGVLLRPQQQRADGEPQRQCDHAGDDERHGHGGGPPSGVGSVCAARISMPATEGECVR
jgi:hypothetical protein